MKAGGSDEGDGDPGPRTCAVCRRVFRINFAKRLLSDNLEGGGVYQVERRYPAVGYVETGPLLHAFGDLFAEITGAVGTEGRELYTCMDNVGFARMELKIETFRFPCLLGIGVYTSPSL